MGKFVIGKKEIEVKDEMFGKVYKALDILANDIGPVIVIASSTYIIGHLMGQNAGYKHGVEVGILCGASSAYGHVFETLKLLKQ